MLADNAIIGDSRVQKQAASAAEHGWDVVLIGRTKDRNQHRVRWRIGGARVRLVRFQEHMIHRLYRYRSPRWRSPLAYRSYGFAAYRRARLTARESLLRTRIGETRGRSGLLNSVNRFRLRLQRRFTDVERNWITYRTNRLTKVAKARASLDRPIDRLSTWFLLKSGGRTAWKALDPELLSFEAAYGGVVDSLAPDIIHANDFRMLGVAVRSALRLRALGHPVKVVWDAHEFLPGIKPWSPNPRWHVAQIMHERQYAPYADAVITVTQPLAELLQAEHKLATPPTVVLNAPTMKSEESDVVDIRARCELGPDVPLLVYSGAAAPQRGLGLMVEAMPQLPGVAVALVVAFPTNAYVEGLIVRAKELGVEDRLYVLRYVPVRDIVPFLSTATVGVIPAVHTINHHISLGTKFFEYSHAGLPILVSDLKAMADKVHETGQGEVFVAEDLDDYVRAVRALLADPDRYRKAYEDSEMLASWSWEAQAEVLDEVYRSVLDS